MLTAAARNGHTRVVTSLVDVLKAHPAGPRQLSDAKILGVAATSAAAAGHTGCVDALVTAGADLAVVDKVCIDARFNNHVHRGLNGQHAEVGIHFSVVERLLACRMAARRCWPPPMDATWTSCRFCLRKGSPPSRCLTNTYALQVSNFVDVLFCAPGGAEPHARCRGSRLPRPHGCAGSGGVCRQLRRGDSRRRQQLRHFGFGDMQLVTRTHTK